MKNWFAVPETVRLELSDDAWIEAKKSLTYAEAQALETSVWREKGGKLVFDNSHIAIDRMVAWLVDWSAKDGNGAHVAVTRANMESLSDEAGQEITAALVAHIERSQATRSLATADELIAQHRKAIAEIEEAKNVTTPG